MATSLELAVPEAHKHLLEKAYTDKLQAALEEYFGRRIRVQITTGGGSGKTPAEIENQERQAKLAKAIAVHRRRSRSCANWWRISTRA